MKRFIGCALVPLVMISLAVPMASAGARQSYATEVAAASTSPFVTTCGPSLCLEGRRWQLHGASFIAGWHDIPGRVAMARDAGMTALRVVNFSCSTCHPSTAYTEEYWRRVDESIAEARKGGLKIILDLSDYRNMIYNNGGNPYTTDWRRYVRFAATRINTYTGVRYADDPTIALVSFAGEVEPLVKGSPSYERGITAAQVVKFFRRTFAQWKTYDTNHLLNTGSQGHMDWPSGVPWREMFALPGNSVCAIAIYGESTRNVVPPMMSDYCNGQLGKPWITEEFGFPQSIGDATRAAEVRATYEVNRAHGSAGTSLWNLGDQEKSQPGYATTYDIYPGTPLTWAVVQEESVRGRV